MFDDQSGVGARARSVYFPAEHPDPAGLQAKHQLADAIRGLADGVVRLDAASAGEDAIRPVLEAVENARRRLEALPTISGTGTMTGRSVESSLRERGPYVGLSNPLAAPLHLEVVDGVTRGWAVYGAPYEGGTGDMHGGVVAAAFDDLLGCAQMVGPVAGRTGTLTVRFRSPSPIGARIDYEGKLDGVEGRKSICSGVARAGDTILAEAEAVFVAPRAGGYEAR